MSYVEIFLLVFLWHNHISIAHNCFPLVEKILFLSLGSLHDLKIKVRRLKTMTRIPTLITHINLDVGTGVIEDQNFPIYFSLFSFSFTFFSSFYSTSFSSHSFVFSLSFSHSFSSASFTISFSTFF